VKGSNRSILGILMLVFIFFLILMIFASYTMKSIRDGEKFGLDRSGLGKDAIGVIEVNGVIMESKVVVELLHRAEKEKSVKAIIVRINSPGGAVGPSQEIYQEMARIDNEYDQSKGEKGKPVYASFGTVAASGGYYIASAARKIFSNPGTLTGSIGVIMKFVNLSRLFEWAKVKQNNITAGRYKDIGDPGREMTQEERDILESVIGGVHQQFMDDIMKKRKDRVKKDINELAQGQIFSGKQAFDYGLVDELAGLWDAGRSIHKELKLEGELNLKFIKKKKPSGIWKILEDMEEVSSNVLGLIKQQKAEGHGSFYYQLN
jgi:protease-4